MSAVPTSVPPAVPTYQDIARAAERLRAFIPPTPLRSYQLLDDALGLHVLVKHENHQPTNSFKIRNALAALTALTPEQRRRGIIAGSRGNHGAGLAWAGQRLGIPVTICVPEGNNPEKNALIKSFGAALVEKGRFYDDAIGEMNRLATEKGLVEIHSTNNFEVLAGAGTLSLEILDQAQARGEKIDAMIFAIGGGSQAAGAITVRNERQPAIRVYGVQAAAASAYHDSFHAGHPLTKSPQPTIADGIATGAAYDFTFFTLLQGLAGFSTVTEPQIDSALRLLISTTHNLAEGAPAAALAGLQKRAPTLAGQTVTLIVSGSNIDQTTLARIMASGA